MTDPRRRKAAQLREEIVRILATGTGRGFSELLGEVRARAVGRVVDDREVDRGLRVLRKAGQVRYRRPLWELVRP